MPRPLSICMIGVHGRIRGTDPELGVDPDTGGQTLYMLEVARAAAAHADVERVELLTRRFEGLDDAYAQPEEPLSDGARIVRLDAGPAEYLRKEQLWPTLDAFVDAAEAHLRSLPRLPDVLHSHYADAGLVGAKLSERTGIPLVHTGHSLGRIKRERLLAHGQEASEIERRFAMSTRIAAEETTLQAATLVITSTQQEIDEQWGRYDHANAAPMRILPPGTDLERFRPPRGNTWRGHVAEALERFLQEPRKPMILLVARPVPRKNLVAQVEAYAQDAELQEAANLVVVAGTRHDITDLDEHAEEVLTDLLMAIDREDLYGRVAYPKEIRSEDVPKLYRLAAATRGVHVNAALTEPFGLTLLEAAATGLPVVATNDGGPREILSRCDHGVLVDPLEPTDIARGIRDLLFDGERYLRCCIAGLDGVREHYSWKAHADAYVELLRDEVVAPRDERSTS